MCHVTYLQHNGSKGLAKEVTVASSTVTCNRHTVGRTCYLSLD
jgi:hypothetical protein